MDEILKKDLIKELGLDKLTGEQQEEIFGQIGTVLLEGIMSRAISMLSGAEKDELNKITDEENSAGKMLGFLKEKIPNFEDIVKEEIAVLKQDSFDVMSKIG